MPVTGEPNPRQARVSPWDVIVARAAKQENEAAVRAMSMTVAAHARQHQELMRTIERSGGFRVLHEHLAAVAAIRVFDDAAVARMGAVVAAAGLAAKMNAPHPDAVKSMQLGLAQLAVSTSGVRQWTSGVDADWVRRVVGEMPPGDARRLAAVSTAAAAAAPAAVEEAAAALDADADEVVEIADPYGEPIILNVLYVRLWVLTVVLSLALWLRIAHPEFGSAIADAVGLTAFGYTVYAVGKDRRRAA